MNKESDPRGRERIYAEAMADMQTRIAHLEAKVAELTEQTSTHASEIHKLRLDRQITRFPRWFWTRLKRRFGGSSASQQASGARIAASVPYRRPSKRTLAVVVPAYRTAKDGYGGQPIERRLRYYKAAGFDVTVVVASTSADGPGDHDGIRIVHSRPGDLASAIHDVNPSQICLHHPLPDQWAAAKQFIDQVPVHVWIHGFEARDWRELEFNYTAREISEQASKLDAITFERRETIRDVFVTRSAEKIFVSDFMKTIAEDFAGIPAENSRVIHNVIDTKTFAYGPKSAEDRLRILSVRNFARRNYGTDLIRDAIELLKDEPFFDELTFSVFGDGQHFAEDTATLKDLGNVTVTRQFLDVGGMASAFKGHGVILIPTRWDSQGMTMGEAMSSGLVPVTNGVAAIPEFADESCAILAGPEDARGLADGIARLYREPDLYLALSAAAARRVRAQCGPENTVQLELDLLEQAEAR